MLGGDGTVNEAVNGVLAAARTEPPELAILPRGTGTDFVRTFGIPTNLDRALEIAVSGRARAIDAGRVTYRSWSGEEETSHFANIASSTPRRRLSASPTGT